MHMKQQSESLCLVQEAGLKVKEYELLRKNFSDSGNFGEAQHDLRVLISSSNACLLPAVG